VLFPFSPVYFLFISSLLLFAFLFLVAFFLLLTLPHVKEDARSHPGIGFRRFPYFNLTFQDARHFLVSLFHYYLLSRIN
jgi:hypothetical protein